MKNKTKKENFETREKNVYVGSEHSYCCLFNMKTKQHNKGITVTAYDVGKKRIIYQKIQQENPHPMETAYGLFAIFQNPQIPKGKKDMVKFKFF